MRSFSLLFTLMLSGRQRLSFAQNDTPSYFKDTETTYDLWADENANQYENSVFLSNGNKEGSSEALLGTMVHWKIDGDHLNLAVAAPSSGWIAFGISEQGGMRGSDMFIYDALTDSVKDYHVLEALYPIEDSCHHWNLVKSTIGDDGVSVVEVQRLLDTKDTQDRAIVNDASLLVQPHRVIAAWGDATASIPSPHTPKTRVRGSIRFYGTSGSELEQFQANMEAESTGTVDLVAKNYLITTRVTQYVDFCFSAEDLRSMGVPMGESLHTIGIEPIIDQVPYVHHLTMYATEDETMPCSRMFDFEHFTYAWAPGDGPLHLPSNVGQPLGEGGYKSFKLEIHYDNPNKDVFKIDSSGVRFHYTNKKREHNLGIWQVGDPYLALSGDKVGDGLVSHIFDCPSACSSTYFPEPVTVLREHLHMHATGAQMFNAHIRNGQELRRAKVDFFDFDQSGNFAPVQDAYEFRPGDSYRTECAFNAGDGEVWGQGSDDEMCIAFIFYYPRAEIGYSPYCGMDHWWDGDCDASHETEALTEVPRTFGTAPTICNAAPGGEDPIIEGESETSDEISTGAPVASPTGDTTTDTSSAFFSSSHFVVLVMSGFICLRMI